MIRRDRMALRRKPTWLRTPIGATPRSRTIKRLIRELIERNGVVPSNREVAQILGTSEMKVRRHRRFTGM